MKEIGTCGSAVSLEKSNLHQRAAVQNPSDSDGVQPSRQGVEQSNANARSVDRFGLVRVHAG
jgi:hypothetical protein